MTMNVTAMNWRPILLAGALSVLAVAVGWWMGGDHIEQAGLAARYTARVAFPLFILVYSASSLVTLWPMEWTRSLLRNRRHWGLAFALAHTVHLVALATFLSISGESRGLVTFVGGGAAYLLLYLMAATSNAAAMRVLGPWWKRLHSLGIHWLWFVFAFSYFGRLSDPERFVIGATFFPIALAALALRVAAWMKRRQPRQVVASVR